MLYDKIVPTDFLEMVLSNGCEYLSLQGSKLKGSLSFQQESELKYLDLSFCKSSIRTFDEIIKSCHSLQKLSLANLPLTLDRINTVCIQNSKTLQVLDLSSGQGLSITSIQNIVAKCVDLKEINFADTMLSQDSVNFLVKNLTSKIEKVNLSGLEIMDEHIELLLEKCKQIKVTFICSSAKLT